MQLRILDINGTTERVSSTEVRLILCSNRERKYQLFLKVSLLSFLLPRDVSYLLGAGNGYLIQHTSFRISVITHKENILDTGYLINPRYRLLTERFQNGPILLHSSSETLRVIRSAISSWLLCNAVS